MAMVAHVFTPVAVSAEKFHQRASNSRLPQKQVLPSLRPGRHASLSGGGLSSSSRRAPAVHLPSRHAPAVGATPSVATTSEAPSEASSPPTIELTFLQPDAGPDGQPQVELMVAVGSGEAQLRKLMNAEKLELYALFGKVMNCGGGGTCGTCMVEIVEGGDLLSERTGAEDKALKKRPENWRLACQTIVGDKSNSGKVTVRMRPQAAKSA